KTYLHSAPAWIAPPSPQQHLSRIDDLEVEQRFLPRLRWMRANAPRIESPRDSPRSGVERERERVLPRRCGVSNVDTPFAAYHAIGIIDYRAIARKLGSPLVDEPHSLDPCLLGFRDRGPLPSNLAQVLKEFGDIARRCSPTGSGRLRRC